MIDGLISPRGLSSLPGGGLLIAEGGAGRLLRLTPDGGIVVLEEKLPHLLETGPDSDSASGVSSALLFQGAYYFVVGEARAKGHRELYRLMPGSPPVGMTGQDVFNFDGPNLLTNPYDLAVDADGSFLVSDAGLNALLRVTQAGELTKYASFPARPVPPEAGEGSMDVVPTGLTLGPDGALYMASLTGYPFPTGEAYVYRVRDINDDGNALGEGEVTVFAKGFTAATDLAFEEDGSLLVTEFSTAMAELSADLTLEAAATLTGRLVRLTLDGELEIVADGLVSPTSVAVSDGRIFVSQELAGRVVEIDTGRARHLGFGGWFASVLTGLAVTLAAVTGVSWGLGRKRRLEGKA